MRFHSPAPTPVEPNGRARQDFVIYIPPLFGNYPVAPFGTNGSIPSPTTPRWHRAKEKEATRCVPSEGAFIATKMIPK